MCAENVYGFGRYLLDSEDEYRDFLFFLFGDLERERLRLFETRDALKHEKIRSRQHLQ